MTEVFVIAAPIIAAAGLVGSSPIEAKVGSLTGCSVVAVERGDVVTVDFPDGFRIAEGDAVYICGLESNIERYYTAFPGSRTT